MAKRIIYNENARRALEKGMDTLSESVAVTLGPKGRNVVLEKKFGAPQIVNDGVTIAKEIELEDHIENTGVALIRQAASKTNDAAGDGTTTATVLAHAMVKEGLEMWLLVQMRSHSNAALIRPPRTWLSRLLAMLVQWKIPLLWLRWAPSLQGTTQKWAT